MPKPLTPIQKRAATVRAVNRREAMNLIPQEGTPYLHVGNERYANLGRVVHALGIADAVTFARDPRSLMRWGHYGNVATNVLSLMILRHRRLLTPDEQVLCNNARTMQDLGLIADSDGHSDAFKTMIHLSRAIRTFASRNDTERSTDVTADEAASLLQALATVTAVIGLTEDLGIPMTEQHLRQGVAGILADPVHLMNLIHEYARQNA